MFVSNLFSSSFPSFKAFLVAFMHDLHHYTCETLALDSLVSLLLIFHVLCCLPPCDSANQFFAHYSISYDSNKVTLHSLNTACVRVSLVSSYVKFCTSYSNPPGLGRIFTHLVPLFTLPLLPDVYNTSLVDIMMLITM